MSAKMYYISITWHEIQFSLYSWGIFLGIYFLLFNVKFFPIDGNLGSLILKNSQYEMVKEKVLEQLFHQPKSKDMHQLCLFLIP